MNSCRSCIRLRLLQMNSFSVFTVMMNVYLTPEQAFVLKQHIFLEDKIVYLMGLLEDYLTVSKVLGISTEEVVKGLISYGVI